MAENQITDYITETDASFLFHIFINLYFKGDETLFACSFAQLGNDRYNIRIETTKSVVELFSLKFNGINRDKELIDLVISETSYDVVSEVFKRNGFDFLIPSKQLLNEEYLKNLQNLFEN